MHAVHKSSASHCFHRIIINAHSNILTGHVPGFPPGHSCRLLLSSVIYLWQIYRFLPSSLPKSIERLFHDSPAKSWSIYNEHCWPNHRFPACFVHMLSICTAGLPFSFPRNMPLFREVLSFYGDYQGTAKSWRFPCVISWVGRLFTRLLLLPLLQWLLAISTRAMAAGLAWFLVSWWLGNHLSGLGTDYRQELSHVLWSYSYQRLAVLLGIPSLPGGESALRIPSSVFPFVRNEASYYRRTSALCGYATISLHSATPGGAYYWTIYTLYSILVPER
jgi:hypothetical protein